MSSTEEDVAEILISEIQTRPALWNTKLASYKNRRLRDKLYAEVGDVLGISKEAVAARWKNKKDKYRRELKKLPIFRSGDGANSNSSSWPYFPMMSFLKDLMIPATKFGNLSSSEQDDTIHSEEERDSETQSTIDPTSPAPPFSPSSASQPVTRSSSASSSTTSKANRKRLCDTRDDRFLELENKKLEILSHTLGKDAPAPECEDLNFFKSLIPYMEKFQPLQKLKIRNKIQQLIIDEMSLNETWRSGAPVSQPAAQNNNLPPLQHSSSFQEDTPFPPLTYPQYQY